MTEDKTIVDISAMESGLAMDDFTFWRTGEGDPTEWRVLADASAIAKKGDCPDQQ